MTESEITAWIRFSYFEISPRVGNELLEKYDYNIVELLKDSKYIEWQFRDNRKQLDRYHNWKDKDLSADLKNVISKEIRIIPYSSEEYPQKLKHIFDPPSVLYVIGNADFNCDAPVLAVVGSRKADYYGLSITEKITGDLARNGFVIVSGGARGIDSYAHKGSLKGGGETWSVFGCGVCIDYPSDNSLLFMDIVENGGALISEYHPLSEPGKWKFPERNRIISGLCDAILVVQAPQRSGSLITAALAREYGKDVYAVPGNVNDERNSGSNSLIKDGCALIENADDVAFNMGYTILLSNDSVSKNKPVLEPNEQLVFDCISNIPTDTDRLVAATGLPVNELNIAITYLELKGVIKRLPGNSFVRSVLS